MAAAKNLPIYVEMFRGDSAAVQTMYNKWMEDNDVNIRKNIVVIVDCYVPVFGSVNDLVMMLRFTDKTRVSPKKPKPTQLPAK